MMLEDLVNLTDKEILEVIKVCNRSDLSRALLIMPDEVKNRIKLLDLDIYTQTMNVFKNHEIVDVSAVNDSLKRVEEAINSLMQRK